MAWHTSVTNVQNTLDAIAKITEDFVTNPTYCDTVTAVELLNEPAGYIGDDLLTVLKQYYCKQSGLSFTFSCSRSR